MAQEPDWAQWLPRQRWYAGRTRTLTSASVYEVLPLGACVEIPVVEARYSDGSSDRYLAYDVLRQPNSAQELLAQVKPEPAVELPAGTDSRVIDGEQSNTSVVFGERVILKLFRRVVCGVNPDIELSRVLGRAGNPHTAALLGTISATLDGEPWDLAMLTAFAADAVSGWDLATGGAFGVEAYRLGQAVASVHATLASALGTTASTAPVEMMRARLASAVTDVPELAGYRGAIEQRYAAVDGAPVTVQRIHGDLHLGQVLRTPDTWLLIDFEGEPGRPLAQRRQPDSPLRDVAGMLRSFDYAGCGDAAAFCDGYAAAAGMEPRANADVLSAYELDKAVYEARYEARYRPGWLHIPLRAIERLAG